MNRVALALLASAVVACAPQASVPTPTPPAPSSPQVTASPTEIVATPSPSPTAPATPEPPGPCDGKDPRAGTLEPDRFSVVNACAGVRGTVSASDRGTDGTWRIDLKLDYGQTTILNAKNMTALAEALPVFVSCRDDSTANVLATCGAYRSTFPIPPLGAHVAVIGPLVADTQEGWRLVRPAWKIDTLAERPPDIPPTVLYAKQVWSTIRAKWPGVPPAVVIADAEASGGIATSALYPDGLAHLFVSPTSALDDHAIWHEAGHMLHAATLLKRGAIDQLYKPADPVGNDYWRARGFPGTWADSLMNSAWVQLGYEALAETFAAANLGDAEKTSTYGVPLDRAAMLLFFDSLQH